MRDKRYFLSCLGEGLIRFGIKCHAFCTMDAHYHLILETPTCNLSALVHFMGSSFGSRLNSKGWIGHVFSSRFCSKIVANDEYLAVLSKYIHENPRKAKVVDNPAQYPWSSYPYYVWQTEAPEWLRIGSVLGLFGSNLRSARNHYCEFVETKPSQDSSVRSHGDFQLSGDLLMFHNNLEHSPPDLDPQALRSLHEHPLSLDEVYEAVCRFSGLTNLEESPRESPVNLRYLRRIFVYFARQYTTANNASIAARIGNVTSQAVSQQYKTIRKRLADEEKSCPDLMRDLQNVRAMLGVDH